MLEAAPGGLLRVNRGTDANKLILFVNIYGKCNT